MDERAVKRLLVTLAVSIAIILVLKGMMLKVATVKVNRAAAERQQAAPPEPALELAPSPPAVAIDTPATTVGEPSGMDAPAASGVYGAQ